MTVSELQALLWIKIRYLCYCWVCVVTNCINMFSLIKISRVSFMMGHLSDPFYLNFYSCWPCLTVHESGAIWSSHENVLLSKIIVCIVSIRAAIFVTYFYVGRIQSQRISTTCVSGHLCVVWGRIFLIPVNHRTSQTLIANHQDISNTPTILNII